ncbi:aminotransferase [Xylariaceae sp. FL1272]|nr:aminotransferase [Xylariaceae sp. FL1272]
MEEEFQIFSTIRWDPNLLNAPQAGYSDVGWNQSPSPFYMLDFHRDRMLRAAEHWGWEKAIDTLTGDQGLRSLEAFLSKEIENANPKGPLRVKVLLTKDGSLDVIIADTPSVSLETLFPSSLSTVQLDGPGFTVEVDETSITRSPFTHHKTTSRRIYDEARTRSKAVGAGPGEILLVNADDGSVMEGSITTPYFWRNDRWVTPPVSREFSATVGSGGNSGTTRRWALERNLVVEKSVLADSIVDGERIWLSNGLKGFFHGTVKLGDES